MLSRLFDSMAPGQPDSILFRHFDSIMSRLFDNTSPGQLGSMSSRQFDSMHLDSLTEYFLDSLTFKDPDSLAA